MTRQEKSQIIDNLADTLTQYPSFYVADASNLTVANVNKLRRKCFEQGIRYQVVKNTLIKKAIEKLEDATTYTKFAEAVLKNFSVLLIPQNANPTTPAKLLKAFRKEHSSDKPLLKGAFIDGDIFIGDTCLDALSQLKSREELIGDIIALLQSPAKRVVGSLQSGSHKLAGIVKTLSDRNE